MKKIVKLVIIVLVTFALFVLLSLMIPFERSNVFWLSFAFGLAALASQIYVFYTAYKSDHPVKSRFYGYPIMRVGLVYMYIQIPLSFIFMALGFAQFDVDEIFWIPLTIYLILLGFFIVGLLSTEMVRDKIEAQDDALKAKTSAIRALSGKMANVTAMCADPTAKRAVNELAEKIRYSDPMSSEATEGLDRSLFASVNELRDAVAAGNYDAAVRLCGSIEATLAERNRLCKMTKSY